MSAPSPCAALLLACLCVSAAESARGAPPLADPTRPVTAITTGIDGTEVRVQGILTRSGTHLAIVDGKLVRAGDHIADLVIEEITPAGIRYSRDGHLGFARLPLAKVAVRTTAAPERDSR
jgi:hypothetical protein